MRKKMTPRHDEVRPYHRSIELSDAARVLLDHMLAELDWEGEIIVRHSACRLTPLGLDPFYRMEDDVPVDTPTIEVVYRVEGVGIWRSGYAEWQDDHWVVWVLSAIQGTPPGTLWSAETAHVVYEGPRAVP